MRILISILLFSSVSLAIAVGPSIFKGKIKSFDSKTVVVESETHRYKVPRNLIESKNLKAGQEIEMHLSAEQVSSVTTEALKPIKK